LQEAFIERSRLLRGQRRYQASFGLPWGGTLGDDEQSIGWFLVGITHSFFILPLSFGFLLFA
jgi:hypothetical protein